MKLFNVSIASERRQRALAGEVAGENISAEMVPFTFSADRGRAEIREAPFVFVQHLIATVADNITAHLQ